MRPTTMSPSTGSRVNWLWPALILLAGIATYANGLTNPFIFDDFGSVVRNPTIRDLTDLGTVFSPPVETSVAYRPLVNLSFAINYAIGGLNVVGYRVVNLALHLSCALLVFALLRRTFELVAIKGGAGIAGAIALLWVVHPINSEVVDYVSERSDSMMTLCYLAALYASLRAHGSLRPARWLIGSVMACATGMACKESMVTAPVVIVLYDVVYLYGGSGRAIGAALKARWLFYAGLAMTWALLLPSLIASTSISSGGFSSAHATPWTYLLNQTEMVTRYLRLAFWPSSLVNYYGWTRPLELGDVWLPAAFLSALLVAAIALLVRKPHAGFLAVTFFILLAPTSSIVPIAAEVGAERRMYLSLVCLLTLVVTGVYAAWRRLGVATRESRVPARVPAAVLAAATVALALVTVARNREYESALTMARTVLARWPTPMAHHLVGTELSFAGHGDEAIAELTIAARDYAPARYYLGRELGAAGRFDEAVQALMGFIRDEPRAPVVPVAHGLIADAMVRRQLLTEAIPHYRIWLEANPSNASGWTAFGLALAAIGRTDEAADAFRRALSADPNYAQAREGLNGLGIK